MKIPAILLDPEKVFSENLAADEIAAQGSVYDEAHRIYEAIPRIQVPLPKSAQSVYLGENNWWCVRGLGSTFLHLFGIADAPAEAEGYNEVGTHLVTFSEVRHMAGTWLEAPGVTLMKEISESEQPALPSNTPEFQFVVNTLAVMKAHAVELGRL